MRPGIDLPPLRPGASAVARGGVADAHRQQALRDRIDERARRAGAIDPEAGPGQFARCRLGDQQRLLLARAAVPGRLPVAVVPLLPSRTLIGAGEDADV